MEKKKQKVFQESLFPEYEMEQKKKKVECSRSPKRLHELEKQIRLLKEENAKLMFKAKAYDELISSLSLFTTTVVAKSFGWSAQRLNRYLQSKGVQYLQGDVWVLYSKYQNKGYTQICWYEYAVDGQGRPLTRAHTYWTNKGILFIKALLKDDGLISF